MLNCQKIFTRLNPLADITPFGAKTAKETKNLKGINIVNHKTKDIRPPAHRDPRAKLNSALILELKKKIEDRANNHNPTPSQSRIMMATQDIYRQKPCQNNNNRQAELASNAKTDNDNARFKEYFHAPINNQRNFIKSHSYPQDHNPQFSATHGAVTGPLNDDRSRPLCLKTSRLTDLQMTKAIRGQTNSPRSEAHYTGLPQPSKTAVKASGAQSNNYSTVSQKPWENLYTQPTTPPFAKTISLEEAIYADNITCAKTSSTSKGLLSRFLDFFKAIPKHFTSLNPHRA